MYINKRVFSIMRFIGKTRYETNSGIRKHLILLHFSDTLKYIHCNYENIINYMNVNIT
jgi:hypothetical protein